MFNTAKYRMTLWIACMTFIIADDIVEGLDDKVKSLYDLVWSI